MSDEPKISQEQMSQCIAKANEACINIANAIQPAIEGAVEAISNFSKSLEPMMVAAAQAVQRFSEALYAAYLRSGAPYGETQEGYMRWLKEQGDIARYQAEIERIQERQQMLAEMRALAARISEDG